jgi:hypothetical protein
MFSSDHKGPSDWFSGDKLNVLNAVQYMGQLSTMRQLNDAQRQIESIHQAQRATDLICCVQDGNTTSLYHLLLPASGPGGGGGGPSHESIQTALALADSLLRHAMADYNSCMTRRFCRYWFSDRKRRMVELRQSVCELLKSRLDKLATTTVLLPSK